MKNIAFTVIDRLFVVVYGPRDPTDDEWVGYLEAIRRHGIERTMQLVFTEGGGPSARQRRDLEDVLAGHAVPVAVMATSVAVLGMVSAISRVNRQIRAFPPTALHDALAYLEIPASRADLIAHALDELRRSLGRSASPHLGAPPWGHGSDTFTR